jgi:hypothetical protein
MTPTSPLSFVALCEACGLGDWQGLTDNERGRTNAALKQIIAVTADQNDDLRARSIRVHAVAYKQVYPGVSCTPQALVNNWSTVIPLAKEKAAIRIIQNAPASGRDCPDCHGDKWVDAGLDERGFPISKRCPSCNPAPGAGRDPAPVDRPVRVHGAGAVHHPPARPVTSCALCGDEIYEHERQAMYAQWISWHPVSGRSGGGPHDKGKVATRTQALAHGHCVDAAHSGRLNQQDLFTSAEQVDLF